MVTVHGHVKSYSSSFKVLLASIIAIKKNGCFCCQLETSAEEIHSALNKIIDHQTHHRLREAQSRKRAEDLNERVFYWSLGETFAIFCVTLAQVMILKNFFSDRPTLYNRM